MNRYFTYDTCNNEFRTYPTLRAQEKGEEEILADFREYSMENGWSDEVEGVVSGIITARGTMYNIKKRPEKLEDNYDDEGEYWRPDIRFCCDCKMKKLEEEGIDRKIKDKDAIDLLQWVRGELQCLETDILERTKDL